MKSGSTYLTSVFYAATAVFMLQAPAGVLAQDSIEARLKLPRLKLQCDPFIPVATVRLDKNGQAKRDKNGNVIFDRPSAEEIKKQRAECTRQELYGKIFRGREPATDGAGSEPEPAPVPPAEPRTRPILIGPPDDMAYFDPAHDMWFGMIWNPVPGADVHVLCVTSGNDGSSCPASPGEALGLSRSPDTFAEVIPTPAGRTTSVFEMPEFCYPTGRCLWSVAACREVTLRIWDCQYAVPFWRVRVTD